MIATKKKRTAERVEGARRRQPLDRYFSKVVGKALSALDVLKKSQGPLTLSEVATKIRVAKTTVFRILHTLELAGYIERDDAGRYLLTTEARKLLPAPFLKRLTVAALPQLNRLAQELRETASLAVLFDNHIEVVAVAESPHIMRMGNAVGRILPPHASSLGKSIVAFQSDDRREKLLRAFGMYKFTDRTITEQAALKSELDRIRSHGYATDEEENTAGGCCFGVPVLDERGLAVAAVSLSLPKFRLTDEKIIISSLQRVAKALSEEIRGSGY